MENIKGLHNLQILRGLGGNRSLLSCQAGGPIQLWTHDDGSGRQEWNFERTPDGLKFRISISQGLDEPKVNYLARSSNDVFFAQLDENDLNQQWFLVPLLNSPTPDTYNILSAAGPGNSYLSCTPSGDRVDIWNVDDGSGRQRWQIQGVWVQKN